MQRMKRITLVLAAAILTAGLVPTVASADEIELGSTTTPLVAPTCPANPKVPCNIVLTQVTAFETVRDGITYPTTVKKAGELVAVTLGVSPISTDKATVSKDVSYLNSVYGGTAEAELTVLRPVGQHSNMRWAVAAQSLPLQLQPYLGQVAEFPLAQPLPVVPGEIVGITVPTWAPILTIALTPSQFAYRQSRSTSCPKTPLGYAQLTIGDATGYGCNYKGTRIEFTATEVMSPAPNK